MQNSLTTRDHPLLTRWDGLIRSRLEEILGNKDQLLHRAMRYSTLKFGKLFRPKLVLASAHAHGNKQAEKFLDFACAIELLHTYSLIHDDLPAMDNDDERRGQAACHIHFDEATAILAGDALLTLAFEVLCSPDLPDHLVVQAVRSLAQHTGFHGTALGQSLDLDQRAVSADELLRIHRLKTGLLIECAVHFGSLDTDTPTASWCQPVGKHIGEYFQLQDDINDYRSDEAGTNICQVMSIKQVQDRIDDLTEQLEDIFAREPSDFAPIKALLRQLSD